MSDEIQRGAGNTDNNAIPIFPVLAVNFIGALGFSLVIPFLVFLVRRWEGNALVYGIVAATYPAFQFIGGPVLGQWSDKYGRRRVLLLSQTGTLISWVVFATAFFVEPWQLVEFDSGSLSGAVITLPLAIVVFARALDGITGGNISVAHAYLADISAEENRSKNFGKMAVASNLGFIIGPSLSGVLGNTSWGELLPVVAAGGISLIATGIIALYLQESDPCDYRTSERIEEIAQVLGQEERDCFGSDDADARRLSNVVRQPQVPFLLLIYLLIFLGFNLFYTAFPNHAATGLQWNVAQIGLFFTLLSAIMVLVQGPILSKISQVYSEPQLVIVGGIVLSLSFASLTMPYRHLVYAAAVLFGIGNGLLWPSFLALLSRTGNPTIQGALQGIGSSMGSLASIVGLVVGGMLYAEIGASTFWIAAAVMLLCAGLSTRLLSYD